MATINSKSMICIITLILTAPVLCGDLYGANQFGKYFTVNQNTGAGTFISYMEYHSTEIQYNPITNKMYSQIIPDIDFKITEIDVCTGESVGFPIYDGLAFSGLEYVEGYLFGTGTEESVVPVSFVKIDPLLPGVGSSIIDVIYWNHWNATRVGPISGLALDENTGIMYFVDGGCYYYSYEESYFGILNMTTGFATFIGGTGVSCLGSLSFGDGGVLYAGGNRDDGGNIYTIDTETGAATLLGPSGFASVSGLTLVPDDAVCDTNEPTNEPTISPTATDVPSNEPTNEPTTEPTMLSTNQPTNGPTKQPTNNITFNPTIIPIATIQSTFSSTTTSTSTTQTTQTTEIPTNGPTDKPTTNPIAMNQPTNGPIATDQPTDQPTNSLVNLTFSPTIRIQSFGPTTEPTMLSMHPTQNISQQIEVTSSTHSNSYGSYETVGVTDQMPKKSNNHFNIRSLYLSLTIILILFLILLMLCLIVIILMCRKKHKEEKIEKVSSISFYNTSSNGCIVNSGDDNDVVDFVENVLTVGVVNKPPAINIEMVHPDPDYEDEGKNADSENNYLQTQYW